MSLISPNEGNVLYRVLTSSLGWAFANEQAGLGCIHWRSWLKPTALTTLTSPGLARGTQQGPYLSGLRASQPAASDQCAGK